MTLKCAIALCCCAVAIGCMTGGPIAGEFDKFPNPFGTQFQSRQEVLDSIPVGTPAEKAQSVMRAHGFEQSSRQQHGNQVSLTFHVYDPGRLRDPSREGWVILHLRQGTVADVEFRQGMAGPEQLPR